MDKKYRMADKFEREQRYVVIKTKDLNSLSPETTDKLADVLFKVNEHRRSLGKRLVDCVVVENDWPESDLVWSMIEARVNGTKNPHDAMQDRIEDLEHLNDELHSLVNKETGLALTVNNDAVFIDGLGSLPIGTADTVNEQAQRIKELEQERDQLKAQNDELLKAMQSATSNKKIASVNLIKKNDCHTKGIGKMLSRSAGEMTEALNKSPAACLAEIQAKAIEGLAEELRDGLNPIDSKQGRLIAEYFLSNMFDHVNRLRHKATDISTQVVEECDHDWDEVKPGLFQCTYPKCHAERKGPNSTS